MELKEHIPDKVALQTLLNTNINSITTDIREEVGQLEIEYVRFCRYHRVSVLILSLAFLLPNLAVFLLGIVLTDLPTAGRYFIGLLAIMVSLSICGYYGGRLLLSGYEVIQKFHKSVDKIAYSKVFELVGLKGSLLTHSVYISNKQLDTISSKWIQLYEIIKNHYHEVRQSPEAQAVFAELTASELITEQFNTTQIDSVFEVVVAGAPLTISELEITFEEGAGRKKIIKPIFKGYLATFPLNKTLSGKTFISTEGDLYGFAHRTYWEGLASGDVKEILFDSQEFEDLLHVASSNEKEAREIITPTFMHDLYSWWQVQNSNIRVAFISNKMYLLFPDDRIRFEETVTELTENQIKDYLTTIAEPLLSVIHLVEDVEV